uniref:Uncharacterized protein n=1 Tax=Chenopodium quinoa TaxID=63459 RepID=A0A803MTE7_CHEQI
MVMDSLDTITTLEVNKHALTKMVMAMDLAFIRLFDNWRVYTFTNWTRRVLPMPLHHSCGIHMLMAIKRNAQTFVTEMGEVTDMEHERAWLLCEDVMSEFNEARPYVQELIKDFCL